MASQWTRRRVLQAGGAVTMFGIAGCSGRSDSGTTSSLNTAALTLLDGGTLVTSPSCPCCHGYADVLGENGVETLEIDERDNYTQVKQEAGIPRKLWACHTITANGYALEGHLPLAAVEKVAAEQPDIAGIAIPGMPAGSPGMGGRKDGEFVVYAVQHDGSASEFLRV